MAARCAAQRSPPRSIRAAVATAAPQRPAAVGGRGQRKLRADARAPSESSGRGGENRRFSLGYWVERVLKKAKAWASSFKSL